MIRLSFLLAREMVGSEKVFGIYNDGTIIFFNAMPRKKHFTNFAIGFYRILGISMMLRNYYFLLSGIRIRGLFYLASNTIVTSSVVDTDHHYIGDDGLSNFSQTMMLIPGDLKHVGNISAAVLRIAFAFALICFIRKNR